MAVHAKPLVDWTLAEPVEEKRKTVVLLLQAINQAPSGWNRIIFELNPPCMNSPFLRPASAVFTPRPRLSARPESGNGKEERGKGGAR